jgi:alanyl-tRNA synthetase
MTRRLYHEDAYLRRFQCEIVAVAAWRGQPAVVTDRSAFYPEAGGQLGDRGTLAGIPVLDTQELGGGIAHVIDGDPPPIGTIVGCELDWPRRRQHMAQHTAQHLLSGALLERAGAPTASARLGESALTIDLSRDRIPESELAAAEELANDLIDEDLAVRSWFPEPGVLSTLKLRRDPKVTGDVRIVAIGDFDYSPCGGTHCSRTSQLGAVRITNAERYKGMTRVTFTAGRRTRVELFARDQVLRSVAGELSCGVTEVPASIAKLRRDADHAGAEATALRGRLAAVIAQQLLEGAAGGTAPIAAEVPGDAELLRAIAARIAAAGRDAVLCAAEPAATTVVMLRAAGSRLDCGGLWRLLAAEHAGRGGGRADRAEGRLARRVGDWPQLVDTLLVT